MIMTPFENINNVKCLLTSKTSKKKLYSNKLTMKENLPNNINLIGPPSSFLPSLLERRSDSKPSI